MGEDENSALPDKITLVAPGGFITGGAMQVGYFEALEDAGIRPKVVAVCATSVGMINGLMFALGRIKDAKELWLGLKPKDVFRRITLKLAVSHFAIMIAAELEEFARWSPKEIPNLVLKHRGRLFIRLLLGILAAAPIFFVLHSLNVVPGGALWFLAVAAGVFLGWHAGDILAPILGCISRILCAARLNILLRHPRLHTIALNTYQVEKTIKKKFDTPALFQELHDGPIAIIFPVVNYTTGMLEVYAIGNGLCHRIDVKPSEEISLTYIEKLAWSAAMERYVIPLQRIEEIAWAASQIPAFFPLRKIGNEFYYDGAHLKPTPLSYAFDTDCRLIIMFGAAEAPLLTAKPPLTFADVFMRLIAIEQHDRHIHELKIAKEKSQDITQILGIPTLFDHALKNIIEDLVQNKKIDRETALEIRGRFSAVVRQIVAGLKLSFKHDRDIPMVMVVPEWEPSIDPKPFGEYGDFSLIPSLIERGYKETMRTLKYRQVIDK